MFDRRLISHFDWYLLSLVLAISLIGVMAIHSASQGYAEDTPYWLRQLVWIGAGLGVGFFALLLDFRTIGTWSYVLHGVVVAALVALVVMEPSAGGVSRWFVFGPVAIQPSEFVKLTAVLAVAFYFRDSRRVGSLGLTGILIPAVLVLVPFFLIVRQPDLGTAGMLVLTFVPIIVLAGLRARVLVMFAIAGVIAIVMLIASFQLGDYRIDDRSPVVAAQLGGDPALIKRIQDAIGEEFSSSGEMRDRFLATTGYSPKVNQDAILEALAAQSFQPYISHLLRPYQQKRLLTFLDPEKDPLGAGYHIIQSKVAIGSGGFWGKGLGNSTQGTLNFLPERHTDFVFAIFAEEWGFFGVFVLLTLYSLVILRGLQIVFQTRDRFSACLIMGVVSIITAQVLVNAAMVAGLLPVVGVPLPFVSYGGSSMLMLMVGIALILNIRMRRFLWT